MEISFGARIDKPMLNLLHSANKFTKDKPILRAKLLKSITNIRQIPYDSIEYTQNYNTANFDIFIKHISTSANSIDKNTTKKHQVDLHDLYSFYKTDIPQNENPALILLTELSSFLKKHYRH